MKMEICKLGRCG